MSSSSSNSVRSRSTAAPGGAGFVFMLIFGGIFLGTGILALIIALAGLDGPDAASRPFAVTALLGLTFTLFGLVSILYALHARKAAARASDLRERNPHRPWMWREDWAAGRVDCSSRGGLIVAWFFALIWNLLSLPALFAVPKEVVAKGNHIALLALLFPLVGAGLLFWAVRLTLHWRKYGRSTLELAQRPGVVGGLLRGTIHARLDPSALQGVHLSLTCVNRIVTGRGRSRTTQEKILWREESTASVASIAPDVRGAAVPVIFTIPFHCRQTDQSNPSNSIHWQLRAQASVPGIDYDGTFEVPVFKTPESSVNVTGVPVPESAGGAADMAGVKPSRGIRVGRSAAGGTEFYFGPARNLKAALGLTAFLLLWSGCIGLMLHLGAPILFPIVFGLFGLLLLIGAVNLWLGVTRLVVQGDRIELRSGPFGLGRSRSIPCSTISDVQLKIGMQSGGATGTPYYDLMLHHAGGDPICAGPSIRDKREAEWLAARMKQAIGIVRSKAS